jgi:transposase
MIVETSKRVNIPPERRRKYGDELKREAVDLILVHGCGVAEAARNLNINANMPGRWKREQEKHGEHAFPDSMQK